MRRSVARRIKFGLIAFTIVDAGVLSLGVVRIQSAPRSVVGNSELAMQQFTLPPLLNSVPDGEAKQNAATIIGYASQPAIEVKSPGEEGPVLEAEPVPAALLAAAPAQGQPAIPAQSLAIRGASRIHATSARHSSPVHRANSAAAPLTSAFDGASINPPPNPYYLGDPDPAAPVGQSSPVAAGPTATDAAAVATDPVSRDVAASPAPQEQARPQAELAPSAILGSNTDVSAAEQPSLPAAGSTPVVPATP